jgi:hypothetical protein
MLILLGLSGATIPRGLVALAVVGLIHGVGSFGSTMSGQKDRDDRQADAPTANETCVQIQRWEDH